MLLMIAWGKEFHRGITLTKKENLCASVLAKGTYKGDVCGDRGDGWGCRVKTFGGIQDRLLTMLKQIFSF